MADKESYPELRYAEKYRYKTAGTFMTAAGTLIVGVANKVLKIHQYSISSQGTIAYSLNNAKPTGGTVDFGGYLNGGVVASQNPAFLVKPLVPYPNYLCRTTSVGSALCLGTYVTAPVLGTVYFQALYTDYDAS